MRVALLALCVIAVGCAEPCIRHSDCPNQLVCQVGSCVMPVLDGDIPEGGVPEGGVAVVQDAAPDSDAGSDSGADVADATGLLDVGNLAADAAIDASLMGGSLNDVGPDAEEMDGGATDAGVDADVDDSGAVDAGPIDGGDDT